MILRGDFRSEVLQSTINIQFMIPEKINEPKRIIYLLHGMHGNQGSWIDNSMLPYYGKKYDAIFVMPEAGRSFYFDLKHGRSYFTFVSEELPQICKNIFNISHKREDTAVMGYSMGGYGSLYLALTKPEQYGFCGAISPACMYFKPMLEAIKKDIPAYAKKGLNEQEIVKDLYALYGESLEYREEGNIPRLAREFPADKPKPKIYVTCGTEDGLIKENHKFRDDMNELSFDYTYEEWSGGHNFNFFNAALEKTLEFWYKDKTNSGETNFAGD